MANKKISQLTNSLTKATVDSADLLPVVDTSASETKKMTYQELIQPTDANFRIAGSADNTKLVAFEVDGLTTATTRTVTIPDATTTMVGTDTTQTLSNKTLTAPQVNMGSDATGDMYYRNGSATTTRLPIGTSGQILQTSAGGIPEWIANPAAADGSTTQKGVFEEATLAETLARTTTGGTSARLVVNPSTLTTVKTYDYIADAVGTDAYAITVTPAPTAYVDGQIFTFKAGTANTGACTLNVNGLGAISIKKKVSSDLETGDILANQINTVCYYNSTFQLLSAVGQSTPLGLYKVGQTTYDTATADATMTIAHGLGVSPKKVRLTFLGPITTATGVPAVCHFSYNGTTGANVSTGYDNATFRITGGTTVSVYTAVTNAKSTGTVTYDSTNINIAWVKTGSPTGTTYIMWEADA